MLITTITRTFEFDAGHRVLGHEGKCRHLHGHHYKAEVSMSAPALDRLGRVIDFGIVKTIIGGWIDSQWDHNFIVHPDDPMVELWRMPDYRVHVFENKQPYLMPDGMNPTAENMAAVLFDAIASGLLPEPLVVERIRLYETPNCWADCSVPLVRRGLNGTQQ